MKYKSGSDVWTTGGKLVRIIKLFGKPKQFEVYDPTTDADSRWFWIEDTVFDTKDQVVEYHLNLIHEIETTQDTQEVMISIMENRPHHPNSNTANELKEMTQLWKDSDLEIAYSDRILEELGYPQLVSLDTPFMHESMSSLTDIVTIDVSGVGDGKLWHTMTVSPDVEVVMISTEGWAKTQPYKAAIHYPDGHTKVYQMLIDDSSAMQLFV